MAASWQFVTRYLCLRAHAETLQSNVSLCGPNQRRMNVNHLLPQKPKNVNQLLRLGLALMMAKTSKSPVKAVDDGEGM